VAVVVVLLTNCYSGNQIKEGEVDGLCGTYRGDEKYIWGLGRETCRKETIWKT
jgi:hypothetical protein